MAQILCRQLPILLLAGSLIRSLVASPSDGFKSACKDKFLASDGVARNQYSSAIFTFVLYDLVANKELKNDEYDDTKLREAVLKSNGDLRLSYNKHLPPYEALPDTFMYSFAEYSCTTDSNSEGSSVSAFCTSYRNGNANATDIPVEASIDMTNKQAKMISKSICNKVYNQWDDLTTISINFYLSKGLITDMLTPSPSPSPLASQSHSTTNATSEASPKPVATTTNNVPHSTKATLEPTPKPSATPAKKKKPFTDLESTSSKAPSPTPSPTNALTNSLSPTPPPSGVSTSTSVIHESSSTDSPTSDIGSQRSSTTSGIAGASQSQKAVGSPQVAIGISVAAGGLAILAALFGFFVFQRKTRDRKDRTDDFSPDIDGDATLFAEDVPLSDEDPPLSTLSRSNTYEVQSENETFTFIPLKKSRSSTSQASNKTTGSGGMSVAASVVSRTSSKSSHKSVTNESLLSQVKRSFLGGGAKESKVGIATRTTVSPEMDDIEMILGQPSFESTQSREWKKQMKTTTPSFEDKEEKSDFFPEKSKSNVLSILKRKGSHLKKEPAAAASEDSVRRSTLFEASSMQENDIERSNEVPHGEILSDILSDEEPHNEIKKTSSGSSSLMGLISRSKKDKSKAVNTTKWAAAVDETSGSTYYYNEETQETTWIKPEGFVEEPDNKKNFLLRSKKSIEKAEENEDDWQEATDKFSGKPYYFNTMTLQTTWTKPEGFSDGDDGSDS